MHMDISVEMIIFIVVPLIFFKSSDITITFIDSPSSTRSLKCPMITIVLDIITKTVGNADLEKKRQLISIFMSRRFWSSWSTSRTLRIIMNTFARFCLSVPSSNNFFDNIMKYSVRIMSVEYVGFGNNIFKLQSSHNFLNRFLSYAILHYFSD